MEEQERRRHPINHSQAQEQQQHQNTTPPRPSTTWRERIFHSLPLYTGPYNVGYFEVELPVEQPRIFAPHIKRHNRHALQLDTVLFSVYYPTTYSSSSSSSSRLRHPSPPRRRRTTSTSNTKRSASTNGREENEETLRRVPWLPRPRIPTCHGYAEFLSVPHFPMTAYMASTCMWTKLPAFRNAKLAGTRPSFSEQGEGNGEEADDDDEHESKKNEKLPTFPVVVFSHGLGGSRTMCSTVCGDMASYGFVVMAMEHRDGSGARTYVNVPPGRESPGLSSWSKAESGLKTKTTNGSERGQGEKSKRARSYLVDYIFPKDNPMDTSPQSEKGIDHELRGAQIEMRLAEVEEAFKVLVVINAGDPEDKIKRLNLRKKPNWGSSSKDLDGIDWADWQGRLSLENVTAMGHSFGGATTVQILRLDDRFPWVGQGVLLDPWGPATPEVAPPRSEQTITKPLISIGSEAFMHWEENYNKVATICAEAKQSRALCWMLTVRGSTHLSQTDFAVLYPRFMSVFFKTLINPLRGIYLTVAPSLEFLKIVLPPAQTTAYYDTSGWADEGLLRSRSHPDNQVSHSHKPDEKWTAARLKVDHELRLRTKMWWNEVFSWKREGGQKRQCGASTVVPEGVPRDQKGRPLFGLENWGPGEEIWVHMCPSRAEVEKHLGCEPEEGDGERPYSVMSGMMSVDNATMP